MISPIAELAAAYTGLSAFARTAGSDQLSTGPDYSYLKSGFITSGQSRNTRNAFAATFRRLRPLELCFCYED